MFEYESNKIKVKVRKHFDKHAYIPLKLVQKINVLMWGCHIDTMLNNILGAHKVPAEG